MNRTEITKKTRSAATALLKERGYIAPVDVLLQMDVISAKAYEDWRMGRIPYLEKVTNCGLGKLNTIMKALRALSAELHLKPSLTVYKKWGKGKKISLRFSKSGHHHVEKLYSTHYVTRKHLKLQVRSARGNITGLIFDMDSGKILVVKGIEDARMPYKKWYEAGLRAAWFTVTDKTVITRGGAKVSTEELEIGQKVQVWADRDMMESYPEQGGARKMVIMED